MSALDTATPESRRHLADLIAGVELLYDEGAMSATIGLAAVVLQQFRRLGWPGTGGNEEGFNAAALREAEARIERWMSGEGIPRAADVEPIVSALHDCGERLLVSRRRVSWLPDFRNPWTRWVALTVGILGVSAALFPFLNAGKHGLRAEYFYGTNLKGLIKAGRTARVDYRMPFWVPLERHEQVSIRWAGYVEAPQAGDYQFFTESDDGVRLWIDDTKVIDNWSVHAAAFDRASVTLPAGRHRLKLEYFQDEGDWAIRLLWQPPGAKESRVIESKYLFLSDHE